MTKMHAFVNMLMTAKVSGEIKQDITNTFYVNDIWRLKRFEMVPVAHYVYVNYQR